MIMDDEWFMEWYHTKASDEEKRVLNRVYDFADCFEDMLFEEGTSTYNLIKCESFDNKENQWVTDEVSLPPQLKYFSYSFFHYKVENLAENTGGYYSPSKQTLCISRKYLDNERTLDRIILHEMIHLHEDVLNELPFYYHDMMYWALYSDLEKRIPKLDEIITNHAHLLTGTDLYNKGGLHDILFLLKSFDLDIRKRYPLGTVFSYGRQNEFQHYTYLLVAKETQSKIVEMVKDIQIGDVAYIVHKGLRTIGHTTSDIVDKALRYDTIRRHRRNMNRKQTKASQDSEVKQ